MATTTKYITLDNLTTYTTNIKAYIGTEDAKKSIKVEKLVSPNTDMVASYRVYQNLDATGNVVADTQTWDIDIPKSNSITGGMLKTVAAIDPDGVPESGDETPEKHYIALTVDGETDTVDIDITALFDADAALQAAIDKLNGAVTEEGSVLKAIYDNAAAAKYETVEMYSNGSDRITKKEYDALDASAQAAYTADGTKDVTIKEAIEDAKASATAAGKVTIEEATTPTTGYLKTYVISQADEEVGKIDIPKDFLVRSGSIVEFGGNDVDGYTKDSAPISELPAGVTEIGKYIELVINVADDSATSSTIYIAVKDLVDVYTAEENAVQVQLTISSSNEISAEIVDGSIDTDAIADKAVTLDKLSQEVQDALAATNGSFVHKGIVDAVPASGNAVGDAYTVGGVLKLCTVADDADTSTAATFIDIAVNTSFTGTGYKIGTTDVNIKKYIDSRIFVGTADEIAAAEAAGEIDETTFTITVDESGEGGSLEPATEEDINGLFSLI